MPVQNAEISAAFDQVADILEIDGANSFRVRAYRTAARNIANLPFSAAEMVERGEDITSIPGIGKDLAGKIVEMVRTGKLSLLEELKRNIPPDMLEITGLAGIGPKRARMLYEGLGITGIKGLAKAAREGKLRQLPNFGVKTEQRILEEIQRKGKMVGGETRYRLATAEEIARPLLAYLRAIKGVRNVEVAGSFRRRLETVGDIDIVISHDAGADIMERFTNYEDVVRVISKGDTLSSVVLRIGIQVDLRSVPAEVFGAALHHFTGSKAHNIAIRKIGIEKGLKINEYGVFLGAERIAGKTEEEVYDQVDLPYIEPELREYRGEIQAAQEGWLPRLVTLDDIRGDLHAHTTLTDGRASLEEMVSAAKKKGYEYLAITEHTRHTTIAHGVGAEQLAERLNKIERLNEKLDGLTILKSAEVDILEDGSLDLPDSILERLDLLVCSIHYKFRLSREAQTERMLRAMHHPYFIVIAHATGRMLGTREPYDIDIERVLQAARETGTVMELNAQPARLDLNDVYCRTAKNMGVMLAISTDAHSTGELDFMRFGLYQARRGWLEAGNVLNTRSRAELMALLHRKVATVG